MPHVLDNLEDDLDAYSEAGPTASFILLKAAHLHMVDLQSSVVELGFLT